MRGWRLACFIGIMLPVGFACMCWGEVFRGSPWLGRMLASIAACGIWRIMSPPCETRTGSGGLAFRRSRRRR